MTTGRVTHFIQYIIFAIVLFLLILVATYCAETQGVCLKSARILGDEELRKAVFINEINREIKGLFMDNQRYENDLWWVGISSPARETDLRKIVEASYNNGKSLEENFGLKILLAGRNGGEYKPFTSDQLHEPFIFSYYITVRGGSASFLSSEKIKEVKFSELKAEQKESVRNKITRYKKFLGYGNHYFYFHISPFFAFGRECCDNRDQDIDDYMDNKRRAYDEVFSLIKQDEEDAGRPYVVAVSNCGDMLLNESDDIHLFR